jgi:hypothetical protein
MPTDIVYWLSMAAAGGVGGLMYWSVAQGARTLARVRARNRR